MIHPTAPLQIIVCCTGDHLLGGHRSHRGGGLQLGLLKVEASWGGVETAKDCQRVFLHYAQKGRQRMALSMTSQLDINAPLLPQLQFSKFVRCGSGGKAVGGAQHLWTGIVGCLAAQ